MMPSLVCLKRLKTMVPLITYFTYCVDKKIVPLEDILLLEGTSYSMKWNYSAILFAYKGRTYLC